MLVERLPHVMGVADPEMVAPLHEELRRNGVDLRLGVSVEAIDAQGNWPRGRALGRLVRRVRPRPPRRRRPSRDAARARGGPRDRKLRRHPRRRAHAHERPGDLGGRRRGRGDGPRARGPGSHPPGRAGQSAGPHRRGQHPRTGQPVRGHAGHRDLQGVRPRLRDDRRLGSRPRARWDDRSAGSTSTRPITRPTIPALSRSASSSCSIRRTGGSSARRPWERAASTSASTSSPRRFAPA